MTPISIALATATLIIALKGQIVDVVSQLELGGCSRDNCQKQPGIPSQEKDHRGTVANSARDGASESERSMPLCLLSLRDDATSQVSPARMV